MELYKKIQEGFILLALFVFLVLGGFIVNHPEWQFDISALNGSNLIEFITAHPGKPSMHLEKLLNQDGDIYFNVSEGYEYRVIIYPRSEEHSPRKLGVTVTKNSEVIKQYAAKLESKASYSEYGYTIYYEYSPKCAVFIPQQGGGSKISVRVLEKGQDNEYFVKIYEGGSTKAYRDVCPFIQLSGFIFIISLLLFIIGISECMRKWGVPATVIIIAIICIGILIYGYIGDCEVCV